MEDYGSIIEARKTLRAMLDFMDKAEVFMNDNDLFIADKIVKDWSFFSKHCNNLKTGRGTIIKKEIVGGNYEYFSEMPNSGVGIAMNHKGIPLELDLEAKEYLEHAKGREVEVWACMTPMWFYIKRMELLK